MCVRACVWRYDFIARWPRNSKLKRRSYAPLHISKCTYLFLLIFLKKKMFMYFVWSHHFILWIPTYENIFATTLQCLCVMCVYICFKCEIIWVIIQKKKLITIQMRGPRFGKTMSNDLWSTAFSRLRHTSTPILSLPFSNVRMFTQISHSLLLQKKTHSHTHVHTHTYIYITICSLECRPSSR